MNNFRVYLAPNARMVNSKKQNFVTMDQRKEAQLDDSDGVVITDSMENTGNAD